MAAVRRYLHKRHEEGQGDLTSTQMLYRELSNRQ